MTIFGSDNKYTKTNETIEAESTQVEDHLNAMAQAEATDALLATGLGAIHRRLGEMWMWEKERRS